ncbi:anti-sigma factor family protein [Streptomyces sp. NPDC001135]
MTSTTDTAGHPDVEEISDLTEGLLPPDRSSAIRQHLDSCELCADVHASLDEIRGLLGSVSEAVRMPADVAGRIDATLAAEALLSASEDDTSGLVSRETPGTASRPAGRPQGATGPGRKKSRRSRRRTVVLGGVLTAAVLGAGALVVQVFGSGTSTPTAHGRPSPSSSAFSGVSVQNQVRDLLASNKDTGQRPRSGIDSGRDTPGGTESANTLLRTEIPVPGCIRRVIPRSDHALASKVGTYAGRSAYLVVVPDTHDSARVTAYVVDAACMSQPPTASGTVLLKESFPRH